MKLETVHPSDSCSKTTSLPKRYYTDESVYIRELQWLRGHMWFLVGHESQVPRAGDYFLYEFDQDSVIVVRDRQGQVRAHHNVCRHRGSRICMQASGTVRTLTCPYHAWSYEIDGRLRAAPLTAADFKKHLYPLKACHVYVHCGLIFLSFAESPPRFSAYFGFLTRELELQNVQHAKVIKRTVMTANANWKLVTQNNLECYHCRPAHPTYCAAHRGMTLAKLEKSNDPISYEPVLTSLARSESERSRQFTPLYNGPETPYLQIMARVLIGDGCVTESVGGGPVAPLMGQCAYEGVQTFALPSPLTSIYLNPDYVIVYNFQPRSLRRTDIDVMWLVNRSAVEGVDFEVSKVSAVWEPTLAEDKSLAENTQLGIDSTAYQAGPYTASERWVADFDDWYLRRLINETPSAQKVENEESDAVR